MISTGASEGLVLSGDDSQRLRRSAADAFCAPRCAAANIRLETDAWVSKIRSSAAAWDEYVRGGSPQFAAANREVNSLRRRSTRRNCCSSLGLDRHRS